MPLIDSPRLSDADRREWVRLERYDRVLSTSKVLARKVDKSRRLIGEFLAEGEAVVCVSWGKDSTTIADLVLRDHPDAHLLRVRVEPYPTPEADMVRNAILDRYPRARYREVTVTCPRPRIDTQGDECDCHVRAMREDGADYWRRRRVTGVRAGESGARRMRMRRWGERSDLALAPIGWWDHSDVFAYLASRNLPVHPAYAMSFGGTIDRGALRVDDIGGEPGERFGRREWESHYYPDVVARLTG